MAEPDSGSAPTFREAFCRRFEVAPERFSPEVLRRCFPPASRILGSLLLSLRPSLFQRELEVIERLGQVTDDTLVKSELEGYVYETVRDRAGFRTRTLGLRLSRRQFLRVLRESRS